MDDDEDQICIECGTGMSLNEDGEMECDNPGWCPTMGDMMDRMTREDDNA